MSAAMMLLSGIGGTLVIATRATDPNLVPAASTAAGISLVERLTSDLNYAVALPVQSLYMLEATVEDQDGDGLQESISYLWWSDTGELARGVGDADTLPIGEAAKLEFTYDSYNPNEDGTTELQWLSLNKENTGPLAEAKLNGNNAYGVYFRPVLPTVAVAWSITRVRLWMRSEGKTNGALAMDVHSANDHSLPDVLIQSTSASEQDFQAEFAETQIKFTSTGRLAANRGACITLRNIGSSTAGVLAYGTPSKTTPGSALLGSKDNGGSWELDPDSDLWIEVFGHYYDSRGNCFGSVYLTSVNVTMVAHESTDSVVRTLIPLRNQPRAILP
ncbi:MAG: hypothetical protein R3C99_15260 [Pirellulaceae bacterium]